MSDKIEVEANLDNAIIYQASLYQMRYKRSGTERLKFFYHTGTYSEAVKSAQEFCTLAGVKHIWTSPAIIDLAVVSEKIKTGERVNELE